VSRAGTLIALLLALGCRQDRELSAPGPAPPATRPAVLHDADDRAIRDRIRQPDRVIAALGLKAGQRVADVGAGQGYLTFRLAEAVGPQGRVVATDIDARALAVLRAQAPANVTARKVDANDPGLEAGSYDMVLLSEVDHYLADRVDYLRKLGRALTPEGRIAVTNRRSFRSLLLGAAQRAGYTVTGEVADLPAHFLVFLRPAADVRPAEGRP
jgi:2-polyprenyl-3-methyl-5-hydroxy-6-metoxy-1,4-benzoquinol methylase